MAEGSANFNVRIGVSGKEQIVQTNSLLAEMAGHAKEVLHIAAGQTAETKAGARLFRRMGSYIAMADTALGGLLFKMSRVAMTMGPLGIGLAAVGGAAEYFHRLMNQEREAWDKQISMIGTAREAYKQYQDIISDPKKVASMEKLGIEFDDGYVSTMREITENLYPAYNRQMKTAEAQATSLLELNAKLAGGMKEYAKSIDAVTNNDLWSKANDNTNAAFQLGIGAAIAAAGRWWELGVWKGIDTEKDTYASKSQEFIDQMQSKIRVAENQANLPSLFGIGKEENQKKISEYNDVISAINSKDFAKLNELGYGDMSKTLSTIWGYEDQRDRTNQESIKETADKILKEVEKNNVYTERLAPTGVWSVNLRGGIPYMTKETPISDLISSGGALVSPSAAASVTASADASGGAAGITSDGGMVTASQSSVSSASGGGNVVNNYTWNGDVNIDLENLSDPLSQRVLDAIAQKVLSVMGSAASGAGDAF